MKLSEIIKNIECKVINSNLEIEIKDIKNNSKQILNGDIFIAIKGSLTNGANFIEAAIDAGAVAILTDFENLSIIDTDSYPKVPFIFVSNIRFVEARLARLFYPKQPDFICATTGTNGKSSVVNFVRQMWELMQIPSASIGTVGVHKSNSVAGKSLTTPDAISLNKTLTSLKSEGIENVAIEVSSHGIEQHRVDSIKIMAAGFTNISNDHLDYHKTVGDYFHAKLKLFSNLLSVDGVAVINIDDNYSLEVIEVCKKRNIKVITYGRNKDATIRLDNYQIIDDIQNITIVINEKSYELKLNLITEFQIYNFMCALGLFMVSVNDWVFVLDKVGQLKNEQGRIEYVATSPNGAKIFVDFGHNGDGLKKLLTQFRPYVKQNLICIAGCSGDRPEIRRIEMGSVLNEYADKVIIVDDNPRTENPAKIRETLKKHCPKAMVIPNRYDAINEVIDISRDWDTIVICGTMYEKDKEFIRKKLTSYKMPLDQLLKSSELNMLDNIPKIEIAQISCSSHTKSENGIFVGIRGFTHNGADFAEDAIKNGAKVLVIEEGYQFSSSVDKIIADAGIFVIKVSNTRKVMADLIYNFYGKVAPDNICAITGTSGKSSVVDFCRQMWSHLGLPAISSGTIGILVENVYSQQRILKFSDADYTTPVNGELYKYFQYFKRMGVNHAAVELSSHGLDQMRMENIQIKAAGFTNLGTDHIDFYGSEKSYLKSKARLFSTNLAKDGVAVLNADIPEYNYLKSICEDRGIKIISYGKNGKELKIIEQHIHSTGQDVIIEIFGERLELPLQILGSFQLYNMLCAMGMVIPTIGDWHKLVSVLPKLKNAIGRLEYMGQSKVGTKIYVDFAYKGEALLNTLKTLRNMTNGKIICVFSTCGDVYETRRRRELGEAAAKYADIQILTDDSPRFEDPQKIRDEVLEYCPMAIEIKTGRKDAIARAISLGGESDLILIAGKGHEDYITIGDKNIAYTDQETVLELLKSE